MSPRASTSALIPAVAYVRKSTKGERNGQAKQEKSLSQQRAEIAKMADGQYQILSTFEDDGVSGWKRGQQRPNFHAMLSQVEKLKAQAILCDHLDRFSRATVDEVQLDAAELRKAGLRWIVTASHGTYDLGKRHDIGEILKFVVAVWSANEYSRQLSRRIALARRNKAEQGKRTGGQCAYGYVNDKANGTLKLGEPAKIKTVRWLFEEYAKGRSANRLVGELNSRKVPSPEGHLWYAQTVKLLLRREVYIGRFAFNKKHGGNFHGIDAKGEVVERAELNGEPGKLFVKDNAHPAIVDEKLFAEVQNRLNRMNSKVMRGKRQYALSGILVCGHCGNSLHGAKDKDRILYRCGTATDVGHGIGCPQWHVNERQLLPFIVRMLGKELADLKQLLASPPEELRSPNKERQEQRKQLAETKAKLKDRLAKAVQRMEIVDDETAKTLADRIKEMRQELAEVETQLQTEPTANGFTSDDLARLNAWWENFSSKAVSLPVPSKLNLELAGGLLQDPFSEESAILVDPLAVNDALRELGTKVTLWFKTDTLGWKRTMPDGKMQTQFRHRVVRGRFQLGSKCGKLPKAYLSNSRRAGQPLCPSDGGGEEGVCGEYHPRRGARDRAGSDPKGQGRKHGSSQDSHSLRDW